MEVRSKHYIDTARWIIKVIQSCKTQIQLNGCRQLMYNWNTMYSNRTSSMELYRDMRFELDYQSYRIFNKIQTNESAIS